MYKYKAKIVNVVDGDTFDLDIDLGFHVHIHERVRILDVDTPEARGSKEKELGKIVTEYAEAKYLGKECIISSKRELSPKTDSFGRWLVDIYVDHISIADWYTILGINKLVPNYSEYNVMALLTVLT